jgi:hypothetical protein
MYDQNNVPPPEYRIRPVVRYVVTRYCHGYTHVAGSPCDVNEGQIPISGGSSVICEVPSEQGAYDIARAVAHLEGGTVQQD